MIYKSIDCKQWERNFFKKFQSFMKKCPIVFSIITEPKGVRVTHANSGKSYYFEYDYEQDVKEFIHSIKLFFIPLHYPKVYEEIYEEVDTTPYEKAVLVESGKELSSIPSKTKKYICTKVWRIDRVMLWKDMFILVQENAFNGKILMKPTDKPRLYKMNGSAVMYLRNYRNQKWNTIEDASRAFFENAIYIKDLETV